MAARPVMEKRLHLSVQTLGAQSSLPAPRQQCRRWVQAACSMALKNQWPVQLTLVFADKNAARSLNREHRGKDYATNVLTFVYTQSPVHADIVVCMSVVKAEARAQGKTIKSHLAHMVIHGCLHALGLDHEKPQEAEKMEMLECKLLLRFGIADPYS